ncbi:hypothetical protein TNCT_182441 [Trichonephila clavata]|uniref:Uncharacterized protein n=1 Tax=Trichonephila clavata TaxID=2740835 RepID=A0A8X6LFX7_TRICU|nr:hypothetical protein TNCT_693011 [Trichonephila clavata]GFR09371.1 hypothetical protein TNCT_182441 [Trichonephila clavata]
MAMSSHSFIQVQRSSRQCAWSKTKCNHNHGFFAEIPLRDRRPLYYRQHPLERNAADCFSTDLDSHVRIPDVAV